MHAQETGWAEDAGELSIESLLSIVAEEEYEIARLRQKHARDLAARQPRHRPTPKKSRPEPERQTTFEPSRRGQGSFLFTFFSLCLCIIASLVLLLIDSWLWTKVPVGVGCTCFWSSACHTRRRRPYLACPCYIYFFVIDLCRDTIPIDIEL